jgi:hypothetical protein
MSGQNDFAAMSAKVENFYGTISRRDWAASSGGMGLM